jgi:O-antigen/teichoic acid export membrane protein
VIDLFPDTGKSGVQMQPVAWSTIEKFFQQAIWLLLFFILAPILGPRPYGQFSIVMVFIGFCELVLAVPAIEAQLSMEKLEPNHTRTANLAGLALGILAGSVIFLLAPYIGWAFGDAELNSVFRIMSVLPLTAVLTATPIAFLKSHLKFKQLALRTILSLAIGGVAGVVLAFYGAGVWALVIQVFIQRVTEVAILWRTARTQFDLGWSHRHFLDMRHYAANSFYSRGMGFASGAGPRLILGFFLGDSELGLFVFASRLLDTLIFTTLIPSTEVARVVLRQYEKGQKELVEAFDSFLEDTALVAFPISCGAAAVMPLIFTILLDSRWQPAVFAAQLLILSVLPMLVFCLGSGVLLAMRRPQDEAKLSLALALSGSFCVLLAAPFGLNAACFITLVRQLLLVPLPLQLVSLRCGIPARSVTAAVGPPLVASLVTGCVVTLSAPFVEQQFGNIASLSILVGIGIFIYAILAGIVARESAGRLIAVARRLVLREGAVPPLK